MDIQQDLAIAVKDSGLQPSKIETLLQSFSSNFSKAKEIADKAKSIIVTDEFQTDIMLQARESRLALKSIRIDVERTRKELKEQSLREGKAIDGIANVIKALVIPVEEHLEKQEKYAEVKEMEHLQARYESRVNKLLPYVSDISLYNIKDMSDESFEKLLESTIATDKAKKEAEAQAEAERLKELRKNELEHARKLELAPYGQFINRTLELREMPQDEYDTILGQVKSAKVQYDKEQEKIRKENEELRKKADLDRKAREQAEKKLADEKAAQEKKDREARETEEAKKRAEEEIKRQELLAPDKKKLLNLANTINMIVFPAVESIKAQKILEKAEKELSVITQFISESAKTL